MSCSADASSISAGALVDAGDASRCHESCSGSRISFEVDVSPNVDQCTVTGMLVPTMHPVISVMVSFGNGDETAGLQHPVPFDQLQIHQPVVNVSCTVVEEHAFSCPAVGRCALARCVCQRRRAGALAARTRSRASGRERTRPCVFARLPGAGRLCVSLQ
jgi:hypothetical protein